jgi:hypothetical protein
MTYDRSAALENLKSRHVGAPPPRVPAELSEDLFHIEPDPTADVALEALHEDVGESTDKDARGEVAPGVDPVELPRVIQIGPEHDGLYKEQRPLPRVVKLPVVSPEAPEDTDDSESSPPDGTAEEHRLPGWARKSGQRQLVCDLSLDADAALTRGRTTGERNADTLVRALAMTADDLVSHFIEEKTKPLSRGFVLVTPHKRPPRAQQTRRVTFQLSPQNASALQALSEECSTENLTKVVETALILAFPLTQKQKP